MQKNNLSKEAIRNLEALKQDLGKKVLDKIRKKKEENRLEPYATIFEYPPPEKLDKIRILILGLNGHFVENLPNNDLPQAAKPDHSYFEYFRNEFFKTDLANENLFRKDEIGFFDLIPVRTGGKHILSFDKFKDELKEEIWTYLESGIKVFDPEIILTNSSDVARYLKARLSSDELKFGTTVCYLPIGGREIPIILSGHNSGARKSDEFNKARIIKEICEELNRNHRRLENNQVSIQTVNKHPVEDCKVCREDLTQMKKQMSFRDYEEAEIIFGNWKKHVCLIGMSEQ